MCNEAGKQWTRNFLDGGPYNVVIILLTIAALFMDDLRLWQFPKSADETFGALSIFIFIVFIAEFIVNIVVTKGYTWSFFFWLDLVAALSLVPDIPWIWDEVTGVDSSGGGGAQDSLSVARAARASRAGTKAGRIVRFVRLIRLIRVAKLFELCKSRAQKLADAEEAKKKEERRKRRRAEMEGQQESNVGQHLAEQTTRKVVMMVLCCLFVIPACQVPQTEFSIERAGNHLDTMAKATYINDTTFVDEISYVQDYYNGDRSMLYLAVSTASRQNITSLPFEDSDFEDFRVVELTSVLVNDVELVFSYRYYSKLQAAYSLCLTMVVLFLLTFGAMSINQNTQKLVIQPIEKMLRTVNKLQDDPLAQLDHEAEGHDDGDDDGVNETSMLEGTLIKLTGLLQIGLGDAGSRLIGAAMVGGGDFDPLVPGQKVIAIFGFCDIRRFTDATEQLREEVMMYVNEIGEMVHGIAHDLDGNPNKNVGDAFLLAWSVPKEFQQADLDKFVLAAEDGKADPIRPESADSVEAIVQRQADNALQAIIRIICRVAGAPIQRYVSHPAIVKAFGHTFAVALGFGLHIGWAIEGPLGSLYKIDATYLSPNVNLAETLEGTTKQYKTPLLISGEFYSVLTPKCQSSLRLLDVVVTGGRSEPLRLYSFDINPVTMQEMNEKLQELEDAQDAKSLKENPRRVIQDIHDLQRGIPVEFKDEFRHGVDAYLKGDWAVARTHLQSAHKLYGTDQVGPELYSYLEENDFKAPADWQGVRTI